METTTARSPRPVHGAAMNALRLLGEAAPALGDASDRIALEDVGEVLAEAMGTLLRLHLGQPGRAAHGLASSTELARMIDTFLAIRDPKRRRYCLTVLGDCATAAAEERTCVG